MRRAIPLIALLAACSDAPAPCQTNADCFQGEFCREDGQCRDSSAPGDMSLDMSADMSINAPIDMPSDISTDMPADMTTDMPTNRAPSAGIARVFPDPIPIAGAPLACDYTFSDPDGDADASTVEWLVGEQVVGMGQGFTQYGPGASITCRVTPSDGALAGPPVESLPLTAPPPARVRPALGGAGDQHTCAIHNRRAYCWGEGTNGRLGDGADLPRLSPALVVGEAADAQAITAGLGHSCAVLSGATKCWGYNVSSQLGDDTVGQRLTSDTVMGLASNIVTVSAGADHSCAIDMGGAVHCWGGNTSGQLGDGTMMKRASATPARILTNGVTDLSAGAHHTCAVRDGAAYCWGNNGDGQLGDAIATTRAIPTQVAGLTSGVTAISAGARHTCAIHNGAAKCWGYNADGQLGADGDTPLPVQVVGLTSGVTAIAAGGRHTCAIHNGGAKCWGHNADGQLGDGSDEPMRQAPTQVSGLTSDVTAIFAGAKHTCAVYGGALVCWGNNDAGQLGNNSNISRNTPDSVRFP